MEKKETSVLLSADNKHITIYQQIADIIEGRISSGILKSDMKLLSTRKMAEEFQVSRKTIVSAMELLLMKGKIISKDRVGLFVAPNIATNSKCECHQPLQKDNPTDVIPKFVINDGFPDTQLLPFREFSRSYRKLFNRAAQWHNLGYNSPMGDEKLRKYIADILCKNRNLPTETDELCIVRGAQMALFLISNAILSKGDHIAIETPGYPKAKETFLHAGLQVHSIPVDSNGIDLDRLEKLCRTVKLKAVYVTPRHQYPTTIKMSSERRYKLCTLAEKYKLKVIEDDFGAEFQFTGKRIPPLSASLKKENYIYIGTFSKIFAPAVRVGYLTSSWETVKKIADYRSLVDIQGDAIMERALCELYMYGDMDRHIRRTNKIYKDRLEHITKEIRTYLCNSIAYKKPHGGLAVWISFKPSKDIEAIRLALQMKGIMVPVFEMADGTVGLRIGYASMTKEQATECIMLLSSVIEDIIQIR